MAVNVLIQVETCVRINEQINNTVQQTGIHSLFLPTPVTWVAQILTIGYRKKSCVQKLLFPSAVRLSCISGYRLDLLKALSLLRCYAAKICSW